jgi:hypothetical protein
MTLLPVVLQLRANTRRFLHYRRPSGRGTSDMILRDSNSGGLEVYDINNNQITGAAFIGTVGLDWQFSGVSNFSSVPGETDLLLRNANTGGLEVYDISNNQLTTAAFIGAVGLSRPKFDSPVIFPLGRAMLWTNFIPTGSGTNINTIGIFVVASRR